MLRKGTWFYLMGMFHLLLLLNFDLMARKERILCSVMSLLELGDVELQ